MKRILYYGSEISKERTKQLGYTAYVLGVHCYTLKPEDNEEAIRKEIETRCMNNVGNTQFCSTWTGKPIENFRSFYFIEEKI